MTHAVLTCEEFWRQPAPKDARALLRALRTSVVLIWPRVLAFIRLFHVYTVKNVTTRVFFNHTITFPGRLMSISGFVSNVSHDGELAKQRAIRVVVADDHPIIRYALRQTLTLTGEIDVVGESVVGPDVLGVITQAKQISC
jgi:hypothetical protein